MLLLKVNHINIRRAVVSPASRVDLRQQRTPHMSVWCLLLVLVTSAISGCGWHLRGSSNLELALPAVSLQFQAASAVLQRELRKALTASDVQLVADDKAGVKLTIHSDTQGRRVLSVGSAGKVSEYELQYQLVFSIRDQHDVLLVKDVITQQRDYAFDETEVLAKGDEERQLYDFMRRTAVQSLLRRLQGVASSQSAVTEAEVDGGAELKPETEKPADAN